MRIQLITHLLEYGALVFDQDHKLVVTDYGLLWEGLELLGIKQPEDLLIYLGIN